MNPEKQKTRTADRKKCLRGQRSGQLVKALEHGDLGRVNRLGSVLGEKPCTIYSIASCACIYWSVGLNKNKNRAKSENFWRKTA
jgi:hypothetical protein